MSMMDCLALMLRQNYVFFLKKLSNKAIPNAQTNCTAQLALPKCFVQKYYTKYIDTLEEFVCLKVMTTDGRFSRVFEVRVKVTIHPHNDIPSIHFTYGWNDFIVHNHLNEGDTLLCILNRHGSLEFEVMCFRGTNGAVMYFPYGDDASTSGGA